MLRGGGVFSQLYFTGMFLFIPDCHFRERLCAGIQPGNVLKCPICNHESKDKGGFIRHYGLVHKMVQKWLKEQGIPGFDEDSKPGGHVQSPSPIVRPQGGGQHLVSEYQAEAYQPQGFGGNSNPTPAPVPPQGTLYISTQQPEYQSQNSYYSSPPGSYTDPASQYSPVAGQVKQQQMYSAQLASPAQTSLSGQEMSPQNLGSETYPSPQSTPASNFGGGNNQQYYGQPQDLSRPLDYSQNYYSGNQQHQQQYGQQPLTPQTPNPPVTPQPKTPGSHGAPTPQPTTPQDLHSNLMSPVSYSYEQQPQQQQLPQQQQQQQPQPYFQPGQQTQFGVQSPQPQRPLSRPVTLQPKDTRPGQVARSQSNTNLPAGDEYIGKNKLCLLGYALMWSFLLQSLQLQTLPLLLPFSASFVMVQARTRVTSTAI